MGLKIEIEPHVKEEIIENYEFDKEDEFMRVLEPEINLYHEDIEDIKDTELDNEDRKDIKDTELDNEDIEDIKDTKLDNEDHISLK